MKQQFLSKTPGCRRLILLFLGWGMTPELFPGLHRQGYDLLALWGYGDGKSVGERELAQYDEIVVVAWSLGVRAACEWLRHTTLPITRCVAVNGTTAHISDTKGIPERIFEGTLEGLSDMSLRKFRRRMCRSAAEFAALSFPDIPIAELKAELYFFDNLMPKFGLVNRRWDKAIIGADDAIFTAANQLAYWQDTDITILPEVGHFPPLQRILDTEIVDKGLVEQRFTATAATYIPNAQVQRQVAQTLWGLARPHLPSDNPDLKILEVGASQGVFTELYHDVFPQAAEEYWDLAPLVVGRSVGCNEIYRQVDAETEIRRVPEGTVDIFFSTSTLQWLNSPQRFLDWVRRALRRGGLCVVSFYARDTFGELSAIDPAVTLPYVELKNLMTRLHSSWEQVECQQKRVVLEFDSPLEVLRHLRLTGVNALGRGTSALSIVRRYPLTPQGKSPLTYAPIYLVLRKL